MKREKEAYYMISVVSRLYNIHPQTLRLYEREGLLKPSRSDGNTRLYSEEDLRQLEIILNMTRELGVNLAGVEVVLNMRNKMEELRREVTRFIELLRETFSEEIKTSEELNALVKVPPPKVTKIKIESEDD